MKKFTTIMMALGVAGSALAQTVITGPSSSQSPYLQPLVPNATITSVLTATNAIGSYTMCGTPDGLGAFDNGNGSFTLLMNHEFGNTAGAVRAHGSTGAFISKWVINKSNLSVVSGADLIQNVYLWTGSTYSVYNATTPSTLAAFGRFCSGDLPAVSAFFNSSTGKGTQERIYMNGEETGNEGRAMAHVVTGPDAGNSYELPYLGKASWENYVACPFPGDKTIVIGMDDSTPGQVYVYVGTKTTSGNTITRAGLTNGKLYGVAVLGLINEVNGSIPAAGTMFNLIDMGAIQNQTGATLNTNSNNVGVTNFLRPEDGCWDPSNPRDFYFATTNSITSPSRLWRLRFNDINNPEQGGVITAVLDGTEGQKMFDNLTIDHYGHVMLVEDVGGNIHNGKIWQYNIATDALSLFAQHDTTRFITGGSNFLTIDEEASGIIDVQEILGPGMFLFTDQAHYALPGQIVEGGQLLALYNHFAAQSNPEINVKGNNITILSGNTAIAAADNTNFGSVNIGNSAIKTFVIQNTGPGVLSVKSLSIGGTNAGDFLWLSPPPFPATLAVNASMTVYVKYAPALLGTSNGIIYIHNNDFDESKYSYAIQGVGVTPEINLEGNGVSIPAGNTSINTTDNTDFGATVINLPVTRTYNIQNTGTGTLSITNITINGNNSSMFTFANPVSLPLSLAPGASQILTIQYLPAVPGTNTAIVTVNSDDTDESSYNFMIQGLSMTDVGISKHTTDLSFVSLYPNPAREEAILKMNLEDNARVTVTVLDVQGKLVMSTPEKDLEKGEREIPLNTASLKNGEYFVKVSNGTRSTSIKLVVIH